MASSFSVSLPDLEKEVSQLIIDGKLNARIDTQNMMLIYKQDDARRVSFRNVLNVGDSYLQEMKNTLLRVSLLKSELVVKTERERGSDRMIGGGDSY